MVQAVISSSMSMDGTRGPAHGLLKMLEADWQRQRQIYYGSKAPPMPSKSSAEGKAVFVPKVCMKLGLCVCSAQGQAAFAFWQRLNQVLRKLFKKGSGERRALNSGLVVLQIDSGEERLYFHIGYANLQTYHYTLLRMMERGKPHLVDTPKGRRVVQPLCLFNDEADFCLALHVFFKFDLDCVWQIRARELVLRPQPLLSRLEMCPHHVEIYFEDATPICVWLGWDAEKKTQARLKRKRKPNPPAAKQDIAASERRKTSEPHDEEGAGPLEDLEGGDGEAVEDEDYSPSLASERWEDALEARRLELEEEDIVDAKSSGSENSEPCGDWMMVAGEWLDFAEANALFASKEEVENDESELLNMPRPEEGVSERQIDSSGDHKLERNLLPEFGTAVSDMAPAPAATPADVPGPPGPPDPPDAMMKSSSSGSSGSSDSSSSSSRSPSSSSSSSSSESGAKDEGDEVAKTVARRKTKTQKKPEQEEADCDPDTGEAAGSRGPQGPKAPKIQPDDRVEVPPWGSVRYNFKGENMVAHCEYHEGNCRKTRTVKAGRSAGQGRPMALLVSWLNQADNYETAKQHSSECKPSRKERLAARKEVNEDPECRAFASKYERKRESNEEEEPETIP